MSLAATIDPLALGTDAPRSHAQAWRRRVARAVVDVLGLNGAGPLATEIAQAMNPVARIGTRYGNLLCRAGHGRLVWRAETFFTEEPDTIAWLDRLAPADVLWDVGANVGLYAMYAAKFRGCRVVAFEPEAQNFALLMENIAMNGLAGAKRLVACNAALSSSSGFGALAVRYVTKGGAYNLFRNGVEAVPESVNLVGGSGSLEQIGYGTTIDALVSQDRFPRPTHLKIDVDGIEPEIIAGAIETLRSVRSVLVELNEASATDMAVPGFLESMGFRRTDLTTRTRTTKKKTPMRNHIFYR